MHLRFAIRAFPLVRVRQFDDLLSPRPKFDVAPIDAAWIQHHLRMRTNLRLKCIRIRILPKTRRRTRSPTSPLLAPKSQPRSQTVARLAGSVGQPLL